jgi:hypothetical protein
MNAGFVKETSVLQIDILKTKMLKCLLDGRQCSHCAISLVTSEASEKRK